MYIYLTQIILIIILSIFIYQIILQALPNSNIPKWFLGAYIIFHFCAALLWNLLLNFSKPIMHIFIDLWFFSMYIILFLIVLSFLLNELIIARAVSVIGFLFILTLLIYSFIGSIAFGLLMLYLMFFYIYIMILLFNYPSIKFYD